MGTVAVVASQTVVFTAWDDAKAGTVANLVLVLAVVHGFASQGPTSYRTEYRRRVGSALAELERRPPSAAAINEADLARLPDPVASYVRRPGAVGHPHLHVGPSARRPVGPSTRRPVGHDAGQSGLVGADGGRIRAGDGPGRRWTGPEMDRAETETLFNDLCLLAPAALVEVCVRWETVDEHRASSPTRSSISTTSTASAPT